MNIVKFSRVRDYAYAMGPNADPNTIYLTTDTGNVVVDGKIYGDVRKILNSVLTITKTGDEYTVSITNLNGYRSPGYYYCVGETPYMLVVVETESGAVTEDVYFTSCASSDVNPATDYITRVGTHTIGTTGVAWQSWTLHRLDTGLYWSE